MRAFAATDNPEQSRETHILTFDDGPGADPQVVKSEHIPLRGDRDYPPAVLVVLDDITELTRERRRNDAMLRELIDTLVSVVDRRDPYSAHHSFRVAQVGRCIAEDIALAEDEIATIDVAGRLMNLGKIFVPTDVLTRNGPLSADERALLATTHQVSADLLRNVDFDGPVVETIEQMGEWWDGSGPSTAGRGNPSLGPYSCRRQRLRRDERPARLPSRHDLRSDIPRPDRAGRQQVRSPGRIRSAQPCRQSRRQRQVGAFPGRTRAPDPPPPLHRRGPAAAVASQRSFARPDR
ncbi:MAG: HD domain-containing protein [Rhodobacteraceae bacterium]|nr:HD domain-containing protein [Paracoccaceae bacterium]